MLIIQTKIKHCVFLLSIAMACCRGSQSEDCKLIISTINKSVAQCGCNEWSSASHSRWGCNAGKGPLSLSMLSSDELSIIASIHPGCPHIWPVCWYLKLLCPSRVGPCTLLNLLGFSAVSCLCLWHCSVSVILLAAIFSLTLDISSYRTLLFKSISLLMISILHKILLLRPSRDFCRVVGNSVHLKDNYHHTSVDWVNCLFEVKKHRPALRLSLFISSIVLFSAKIWAVIVLSLSKAAQVLPLVRVDGSSYHV